MESKKESERNVPAIMFDETLGVTIVCRQSTQPNTQESTEQEVDKNETSGITPSNSSEVVIN